MDEQHKIKALTQATQFAIDGNWNSAHDIAQQFHDEHAYWLHAVLHKIEGDIANSRYWYAKTSDKHYKDFEDTHTELKAILAALKLNGF